ncbi:hypothetical protein [Tenacibaculum piscium]|uniref:Uncharacterized protein n=1 Tax=Tenacibaculum piscium TaxID=1458515 RepID=A0A2H1YG91_9FLAO|nr:hypothetical protein [Tenacibaculum piscium]MBE7629582.1 hypothetical protein [Tenacibaculum piscium]MBE7670703.1 hypothetical protein [Tenacibaculum piscium]SOS74505.1 hypothetical protein TNO020_20184 [Tenacibaculum piscium]
MNTSDVSEIKEEYIDSLKHFTENFKSFDISNIIENFQKTIRFKEQKESILYHSIISEIVKLNRADRVVFKDKYYDTLNAVVNNIDKQPFRFVPTNTMCGFVFIPLKPENFKSKKELLAYFTEVYKYKHKLKKCLGVIFVEQNNSIDIEWMLFNNDWKYNKMLEDIVLKEREEYGDSKLVLPKKYFRK